MDNITETQVKPPKSSRRTPIPSDWSDDDGKDDQARAPIAKPVLQDPNQVHHLVPMPVKL